MSTNFFKSNISGVCGELYMNITEDKELKIETEDPCSGDWGAFTLPPTPEGVKEAESIIAALNKWVDNINNLKSINPYIPLQVSHIVFDNEGKVKIKS